MCMCMWYGTYLACCNSITITNVFLVPHIKNSTFGVELNFDSSITLAFYAADPKYNVTLFWTMLSPALVQIV